MTIIINGSNTATAGAVAVGDGTTLNFTAAGLAGQVLTSNGAAVPTWTDNGSGTVTSASVVSANGFAGTVATSTTTPAITLTTSITGLLKGNGTAMSAATAGTDYIAPSGALGTPSSGTLTNCSGLPISTGVNGLGTNVATWLGTPSSANLISVVADETGSGVLVFNTNAALTNPTVTSYIETVYALAGTAISPANGTIQTKTLGANTTFTESLADGQSVVLMLNPVTYTVTWPTMTWISVAGSGSAPTLEASSMNVITMWQVGGTVYGNWAGSA